MRAKLGIVLAAQCRAPPSSARSPISLARARALHKQVPLIDGHNDYPWALRGLDPGRDFGKADITEAGAEADDRHPAPAPGRRRRPVLVGLRAVDDAGQGSRARHARADRHRPSHDEAVARDVRAGATPPPTSSASFKAGRIGSLIGMEGGHSIDNSLATLRMMLRARRALHDADPQRQPAVGRCRPPTSRCSAACRSSAKRWCAR